MHTREKERLMQTSHEAIAGTAEKQDGEGETQAVWQEKRNWFKITSRGKWPTFNYDAYHKPRENERKMGGSSEDRNLNDPDYTWYSVLVHSDM